jgi:hypothetical protein
MTLVERSGAGGGFVLIDCVTALSFCNSDDDEKITGSRRRMDSRAPKFDTSDIHDDFQGFLRISGIQ